MKIWLDKLEPGDTFWICDWQGLREIKIVGSDYTYAMPRRKLSDGTLMYVNSYVFTTKEEAVSEHLPKLREQLEILKKIEIDTKMEIEICRKQLEEYERIKI
jgi:hypothetical protein